MKIKVLLGANKYNEIVFGEFSIRDRGEKHNEFTASFDTVMPFDINAVDIEDSIRDRIENYDCETLYNLCDEYDCSPRALASNFAYDWNINDVFDLSLYPEEIEADGSTWMFESIGCGQHDCKDSMMEFVNEDAFNFLYDTWKEYHLKEISEDTAEKVKSALDALCEVDEEEWIKDFIENHLA